MTIHYRLYLRHQSGSFEVVHEFDCADDAAAIDIAERLRKGGAAEVWNGGRWIHTFSDRSARDPLVSPEP